MSGWRIALLILTIGVASSAPVAGQQLTPVLFANDTYYYAAWSTGTTLYMANQEDVFAISLASGQVSLIARRVGGGETIGFFPFQYSGLHGITGDGSFVFVTNVATASLNRINTRTGEVRPFGAGLNGARGVWADQDNVYVGNGATGDIVRISKSTGATSVVASLGPGGRACLQSSCIGSIRFAPTAITGDGTYLYAEHLGTVRRISIATGEVTTLGGISDVRSVIAVGDDLLIASGTSLLRFSKTSSITTTVAEIPDRTLIAADAAAAYVSPAGLPTRVEKVELSTGAITRMEIPVPDTSRLSFSIPPAGSINTTLRESSSALHVGQARILGVPTPPALEILQLRRPNGLLSEMAVQAAAPVRTGRIPVEIGTSVNTGIAFANPTGQAATIYFDVTDCAGSDFATGVMTLAANAQHAAFVTELPLSRGIFPRPLTDACTLSFSATVPVGAIAVRGLVNERSEFLMASLPVVDLAPGTRRPTIVPYFAEGNGWSSRVTLVNPTDSLITGNIEFVNESGAVIRTVPYSIARRSAASVQTENTGPNIAAGYVRIRAGSQTAAPIASAILSLKTDGVTRTQTGVSAADADRAWLMPPRMEISLESDIMIVNPSASPATVTVERTRFGGETYRNAVRIDIPANSQVRYAEPTFSGRVRFSTDAVSGVIVTGLWKRTFENIWAIIPVIPETNVPDAIFPHIVLGGGYSTELLFLSPQSSPQITGDVQFFAPSGQPLFVTPR